VRIKPVAGVTLALAGALSIGWLWGASGRAEREMARRAEARRADLNEARALTVEGQLQTLRGDWAGARAAFTAARVAVEREQARLRETAQAERAGRLEVVIAHLREAAQLAAEVEPEAISSAEAALEALRRSLD